MLYLLVNRSVGAPQIENHSTGSQLRRVFSPDVRYIRRDSHFHFLDTTTSLFYGADAFTLCGEYCGESWFIYGLNFSRGGSLEKWEIPGGCGFCCSRFGNTDLAEENTLSVKELIQFQNLIL